MVKEQGSQFDVLGLTPKYSVDREQLEDVYLKLAAHWHPDRFVGGDDAERLRATAKTSAINQAYTVIRDPVSRAEHLAALGGWDVENAGNWSGEAAVDQAFLIEMIERREVIAAGGEGLRTLRNQVEEECEQYLDLAIDALTEDRFEAAARALVKRRYFARLLDEIEAELKLAR